MSAPRAGGDGVTAIASSQISPTAIAVDANAVYWTSDVGSVGAGGSVMSIPSGGTTIVTLASGETFPNAIAADATHVYWIGYVGSRTKLHTLRKSP
jgi:hypothetical protein